MSDPFEALERARETGRAIVPLLGAGISVNSGIPASGGIEEYLVKVRWVVTEMIGGRPVDYLFRHGWPDPHQINADILSIPHRKMRRSLQSARRDAYLEAIVFELSRDHPTLAALIERFAYRSDGETAGIDAIFSLLGLDVVGEPGRNPAGAPPSGALAANSSWLTRQERAILELESSARNMFRVRNWTSLLHLLTRGHEGLIDAFFDQLVRGRELGAEHQFIAFLVKQLDISLILTTNFDDLIESALRDEGMSPVVYELTKYTPPPDARLVTRHLSIVKLHGGAYSLRAGFDLGDEPDPALAAAFPAYLPRNPLIVVLGYGGQDQHVISLLKRSIVAAEGPRNDVEILWVHRDPDPPAPVRQLKEMGFPGRVPMVLTEMGAPRPDSPVQTVNYREARLFLQGWHGRLTHSHPVSARPYRVLHHSPLPGPRGLTADDSRRRRQSHAIFLTSHSGWHDSARLAAHVADLEAGLDGGFRPIWVDVSEVRTLPEFMYVLLEQFRRFDHWLMPLPSPVFMRDLDISRLGPFAGEHRVGTAVQVLQDALRRGNYILAIDRLHEFGVLHPEERNLMGNDAASEREGAGLPSPESVREFADLCDVISGVVCTIRGGSAGRSRIALATSQTMAHAAVAMEETLRSVIAVFPEEAQFPEEAKRSEAGNAPQSSGGRAGGFGIPEDPSDAPGAIRSFLFTIASCFRRPRTMVGIHRVAESLLRDWIDRSSPVDKYDSSPGSKWILRLAEWWRPLDEQGNGGQSLGLAAQLRRLRAEFEQLASQQEALRLQEGDAYWLHARVRDGHYRAFLGWAVKWEPELPGRVHDAIANYYHDQVYEHSGDLTAPEPVNDNETVDIRI